MYVRAVVASPLWCQSQRCPAAPCRAVCSSKSSAWDPEGNGAERGGKDARERRRSEVSLARARANAKCVVKSPVRAPEVRRTDRIRGAVVLFRSVVLLLLLLELVSRLCSSCPFPRAAREENRDAFPLPPSSTKEDARVRRVFPRARSHAERVCARACVVCVCVCSCTRVCVCVTS